ncbi:hypothetical protein [Hyphomonas sp.]|uniref:hypothetical protein n=1 Tax=Hyphomonas sp. TaxID=87 RepID=UPI00391B5755
MTLWCWSVVLFGVILMSGSFPATDGLVRWLYEVLGGLPPGSFDLEAAGLRFSVALMGAVTLGWGATILLLLPAIHATGAPAWRGLTIALVIWYAVDGALSVATGFALNIVPNTVLATTYLVPLLASGALKAPGR